MSKFLYVNDTAATYPPSWYAESLHDVQRRFSLNESQNCDVCVIGGGFTGLSTALHLAKKGLKVIVLVSLLKIIMEEILFVVKILWLN